MVIVAVRDVKAGTFSSPHFVQASGIAVRNFSDAVDDPNSYVSKHPEDYQLYLIGTYSEQSGEIVPTPQPEILCSATDFVRNPQQADN